MPTIRIGFSSDFVLKNGVVGLGTTVGSTTDGKLELDNGALRANLSVSGVATLTAYGGFVAQKQHVNKPAAIGFGTVGVGTHQQYYETTTEFTDLGGVHHGDDQYYNTLSEDLVIDDGQILNITNTDMVGVTTIGEYDPHNHSSYVCAGSLEQVSVTGHFSVPNGGTNDRQETPIEGTVRFNTDLNTLEFFNGNEWRQFTYNQGQSGRGLYGGGRVEPGSPTTATVGYINIGSLGNAQYFGELTNSRQNPGACSSSTRGLWGGGTPGFQIDYVTIASAGNAIDFGDLSVNRYLLRGLSSSTRGIWASGWTGSASDVIDYVEISTTGNALDFGDMTSALNASACTSSPTRGLITGGRTPSTYYPLIEFITIASKGDAVDFGGDLTKLSAEHAGASNGTLGLFMGGQTPALSSQCEFVKISSSGNGVFFGDLTETNSNGSATSTNTRGVYIGGRTPSIVNTMEYVTFSSLGNAIDFGDMSAQTKELDACSDSHGGLGGF